MKNCFAKFNFACFLTFSILLDKYFRIYEREKDTSFNGISRIFLNYLIAKQFFYWFENFLFEKIILLKRLDEFWNLLISKYFLLVLLTYWRKFEDWCSCLIDFVFFYWSSIDAVIVCEKVNNEIDWLQR